MSKSDFTIDEVGAEKSGINVTALPGAENIANDEDEKVVSHNVPTKYRGTAADKHDMRVLGKQQVLRRNFKFVTMLGFASTVMVAWEALFVVAPFALEDGGTPAIFWGLIISPIGMSFVYLSLAEMASMSPTAGGQYHWVCWMSDRVRF